MSGYKDEIEQLLTDIERGKEAALADALEHMVTRAKTAAVLSVRAVQRSCQRLSDEMKSENILDNWTMDEIAREMQRLVDHQPEVDAAWHSLRVYRDARRIDDAVARNHAWEASEKEEETEE